MDFSQNGTESMQAGRQAGRESGSLEIVDLDRIHMSMFMSLKKCDLKLENSYVRTNT